MLRYVISNKIDDGGNYAILNTYNAKFVNVLNRSRQLGKFVEIRLL